MTSQFFSILCFNLFFLLLERFCFRLILPLYGLLYSLHTLKVYYQKFFSTILSSLTLSCGQRIRLRSQRPEFNPPQREPRLLFYFCFYFFIFFFLTMLLFSLLFYHRWLYRVASALDSHPTDPSSIHHKVVDDFVSFIFSFSFKFSKGVQGVLHTIKQIFD